MSNLIEKRDIRKTTRALGSYFNQGQITYAMVVDGKNHAADDVAGYLKKYGPFEGEDEGFMNHAVGERYMIDYIWENAAKTKIFYIVFRERALLEPLSKEIEGKIEHSVLTKISDYVLKMESDGKEIVEAAPVVAEAPKPAKLPELNGRPVFLHVGIPVTDKKADMTYIDAFKVWITDPASYAFDIEYLKYEEGTPFPGVLHKNPHIAYMVEDMKPYLEQAQQVIFAPAALTPEIDFAYIMWDDTIFELQAKHK